MNLPDPAHIIANLEAQSQKEAFIELAGLFQDIDQNLLIEALLERESLGTTAIISGMALPHAKINTTSDILLAIGRSKKGIHWGARDGQPIHLIFLMVAPQKSAKSYLQTLAILSRTLRNNSHCALLQSAKDAEEISLVLQGCLHSS